MLGTKVLLGSAPFSAISQNHYSIDEGQQVQYEERERVIKSRLTTYKVIGCVGALGFFAYLWWLLRIIKRTPFPDRWLFLLLGFCCGLLVWYALATRHVPIGAG